VAKERRVINFTIVSSVVDDNILELVGVSDLQFATIGGQGFLFVASEADGAISSFSLSATLAPQLIDSVSYSTGSGTFSVSQITLAGVGSSLTLIPSARYAGDVVPYQIGSGGTITGPIAQPSGGPVASNFTVSRSVVVGGETYLFAAERGTAGFAGYWMQPGDSFSTKTVYSNINFNYLGDISAFASVSIGVRTFLFTASAFDAGLNSFQVQTDGSLNFIDSVAPSDASGFNLPQALEAIDVAGQSYLVMASAGTDSLTVYAVGALGGLTEVDHMIDTVDTRFQDAGVLDSFVFEGRSFILAAGSDDGLTLLELSDTGQLSFLAVLADDFDTTLNNITDIEVVMFGSEIHAFVSSGTENGFTQIQIDLGTIGITVTGNAGHEILNGSPLDDLIFGEGGSDRIYASDGDDRLVDGTGRDHLYGGAGADVFQFVADNTPDLIRDYEQGLDVIDLSSLAGINSLNDLIIYERSYGAIIIAGAEEFRIETMDGTLLNPLTFSASDFIF
jgi:Ca2+-binding RTX toxin-like protein